MVASVVKRGFRTIASRKTTRGLVLRFRLDLGLGVGYCRLRGNLSQGKLS